VVWSANIYLFKIFVQALGKFVIRMWGGEEGGSGGRGWIQNTRYQIQPPWGSGWQRVTCRTKTTEVNWWDEWTTPLYFLNDI
jgi:hypothetical protein